MPEWTIVNDERTYEAALCRLIETPGLGKLWVSSCSMKNVGKFFLMVMHRNLWMPLMP